MLSIILIREKHNFINVLTYLKGIIRAIILNVELVRKINISGTKYNNVECRIGSWINVKW